jgi:hypothetical protein
MTIIQNNPHSPPPLPAAARTLLLSFGHVSVGDGDEVAGMNALVSMCAALAAAAGPDARVVAGNATELSVGVSWLVSGSLSPTLHDNLVIGPLRDAQNTFTQNILVAQLKMPAAQDAKKPMTLGRLHSNRKIPEFTPEILGLAKDRIILEEILPDSTGDRNYASAASRLLERDVLHQPAEFFSRAAFFHDGTDAKILSHQLQFSHRGHPLVDFPLSTRNQAAAAGSALLGVMDGLGLRSALPLHVRGIATARMSGGVLGDILTDYAFAPWLDRMLWLTDISAGPLPPLGKGPTIGNPAKRFGAALRTVLAARLGEQPVVLEAKALLRCHWDFLRHLATLEPTLPRITGSLMNLIPTLYFGMYHLLKAGGPPEGFEWSLDGITALATHLVDRMAYAAVVARRSEDLVRRGELASSICAKLAERPHTDRDLVRRHNRLPIALCREVLAELQASGRVVVRDGAWYLASSSIPANPQPPVIDVA